MAFKPVKKTTFLEAVAAAIQHEKEVFEFYHKHAESLPAGPVKDLFYKLAEECDEHINMIGEIYSQVQGGQAMPNLKMASGIHKFHTTSLSVLMRRLDRNKTQNAGANELEALRLAVQEHDDASTFYSRIADRFEDPNIKFLFQRLSNFQEENRMLLESYMAYEAQGSHAGTQPYWEEDISK